MWMAGGGIKGGVSVGETDELGGAAVARPLPRQEPARHHPAPARPRPQPADATSTAASTRSSSASKGPSRSGRSSPRTGLASRRAVDLAPVLHREILRCASPPLPSSRAWSWPRSPRSRRPTSVPPTASSAPTGARSPSSTPTGEVEWEVGNPSEVHDLAMLPNGNIMFTTSRAEGRRDDPRRRRSSGTSSRSPPRRTRAASRSTPSSACRTGGR